MRPRRLSLRQADVQLGAAERVFETMPSLIRLIVALGLLFGLAYGAMFSLATFVQPKPREITVTLPPEKLAKPR
jgi:hypothetical protein